MSERVRLTRSESLVVVWPAVSQREMVVILRGMVSLRWSVIAVVNGIFVWMSRYFSLHASGWRIRKTQNIEKPESLLSAA